MAELINIRCSQGHLIITETHITTERYGKTQMMERRFFTGLDAKGVLWNHKLIFHGQSNQKLKVSGISGRTARRVQAIMSGH